MDTITTYASDGEEPKRRHYEHSTEFEKPKYFKRPKVSAVRDFPVSFERINAQSNGCGADSNAEPCDTDHVEPKENTLDSEEKDSSLCCLESEVETDDGYCSDELDGATYNDPFEVLDLERSCKLELQHVLNKVYDFAKVGFKPPRVSAIRDFPVAFESDDSVEDII